MKNAFRLTAVAALSVSSFAVSPQRVFAQSSTVPAPSSALRARLRQQILEMVPRLRQGNLTPEGADDLALPLLQLGDWDAARRLATQPRTRDALQSWRVEQLALRGRFTDAMTAAGNIRSPMRKADRYLVIARLAIDSGNLDAATTPLLAAMRSMEKSPDSAELAYAAWLWWRSGDTEAARRVLWGKAWPRAAKENVAEKNEHPDSPGWNPRHESVVLSFATQMGEISEIIRRTTPTAGLGVSWVLAGVRNRTDFDRLRVWLKNSKTILPEDSLILAIAALSLGLKQEAFELRDGARAQIAARSAATSPPNNETPSQRVEGFYLELLFATRSGEEAEAERLMTEMANIPPAKGGVDKGELRAMSLAFRLMKPDMYFSREPAYDLSAAVVSDVTTQTLALPPSEGKGQLLAMLAKIYARRKDGTYAPQIAAAAVAEIEWQTAQFETKNRGNGIWLWSWDMVEAAKGLREMSPGTELPVIQALCQRTPVVFRALRAGQLYHSGFPAAARQIFNPAEAIQRDAALTTAAQRQHDPKMRDALANLRFNPDWDVVTTMQARYENPEAPESWFGQIHDDSRRVAILRAWTAAFYPQPQWKRPYVFRSDTGGSDAVGGAVGSG